MAGVALFLVGAIVQAVGHGWVGRLMPPMVTGAIVALIGLNLAPAAWNNVKQAPVTAFATLVAIVLATVLFRGLLGRLSILLGVLVGYAVAAARGEVDYAAIGEAAWVGAPGSCCRSSTGRSWGCSCRSCSSWSRRTSAT